MKYTTTILTLIVLNIFTAIMLVYFGKISRKIEKINDDAELEIIKLKDQLNINELEYSLHSNYYYLNKLKKIYLSEDNLSRTSANIISLSDFENAKIVNFHKVKAN